VAWRQEGKEKNVMTPLDTSLENGYKAIPAGMVLAVRKGNRMRAKPNVLTQEEAEREAIDREMNSIFAAEGTLRIREDHFHAVHGADYADYSREHRAQDGSGENGGQDDVF